MMTKGNFVGTVATVIVSWMLLFAYKVEASDCDSYDYNEIPYFVDDVPSVIAFSYQQSLNACLAICTSEPHCVVVSYIDFIGSCIRMNYYNASKQTTVLNTKSYIKECVQVTTDPSDNGPDEESTKACYPNGTVTFTNPNTILYTDAMAVQFEGTSSAIICTVSKSGSTVYITGCSMDLDINLFFSNRSDIDTDGTIFGGVPKTTRSYLIRCSDLPGAGVNRTVSNLLAPSIEVTTQDAVTPYFTLSTDLRSESALGSTETFAYVGDLLYWTIDLPAEYNGRPTCTAYSGNSASGTPSSLLVSDGCTTDSSLVVNDFDSEVTPQAGTKRLWTTLYVFKFYNSDDIYFLCTVVVCPSSSSSCDLSCDDRKRSVNDHSSDTGKTATAIVESRLHIVPSLDRNAAPTLLGGVWLLFGVLWCKLFQ